jgi:hypothetical protein
MISNLYFMAVTTYQLSPGESDFKGFLLSSLPESIDGHLPPGAILKSITHKEDLMVSGFLEGFSHHNSQLLQDIRKNNINFEEGVYHIELEGPDNYEMISLPGVEEVIKELHTEYSFIASYFYYLNEDGFQIFSKLHTYLSDEEDDDVDKDFFDSFAPLFKSYFYDNHIPDNYIDKVARMFLTGSRG